MLSLGQRGSGWRARLAQVQGVTKPLFKNQLHPPPVAKRPWMSHFTSVSGESLQEMDGLGHLGGSAVAHLSLAQVVILESQD